MRKVAPGGQEIVRGGEQPTAALDAIVKQAGFKTLSDEEKVTLQKQVQELQEQLARTRVIVPGVIEKSVTEGESIIKEKGLVPEVRRITNPDVEPEVIFDRSPAGGAEVEKSTMVMLFAARKPDLPKDELSGGTPPVPGAGADSLEEEEAVPDEEPAVKEEGGQDLPAAEEPDLDEESRETPDGQ